MTQPDGSEELFIPINIGLRHKLTKDAAKTCAAMWLEATKRYPKAFYVISIVGYDEDPRELWEFEEVRRYIRWFARFAGLNELETADRWLGSGQGRRENPVPEEYLGGVALFAACGVFGEALRQEALRNRKATVAN